MILSDNFNFQYPVEQFANETANRAAFFSSFFSFFFIATNRPTRTKVELRSGWSFPRDFDRGSPQRICNFKVASPMAERNPDCLYVRAIAISFPDIAGKQTGISLALRVCLYLVPTYIPSGKFTLISYFTV